MRQARQGAYIAEAERLSHFKLQIVKEEKGFDNVFGSVIGNIWDRHLCDCSFGGLKG
mgnify:FL=1